MNKGRKIVFSFFITSAIWLAVLATLVILFLILQSKINEYYAEPFSSGLCPSIGLGIKFESRDMDLMIEKYAVYLQETTGTPQFYDRVRDNILEHYTLVGDTYYYNNYLASGVQAYEAINLIPFIIVSSVLFVVSLTSFALCIRRCCEDKIRITKPYAVVMIILSFLSCNVYSAYRFVKGYKEI